jgi:hypothetical protein
LTDDLSGTPAARPIVTEIAADPQTAEALAGTADELPAPEPPAYRLASPGQVGGAGFLGGPLAGFLLMARNYAKLGRTTACWLTVGAGVLVTAIPVGYGLLAPDTHAGFNFCFALPLWLGTYMTAKALQQRAFQAHRKAGGEQVSGWVLVGFVVLGVVLTLGPAVGIAALYEAGFGDQELHVTDKEVVIYSRDVTEAEARTLGRVLQQQGLFNGAGEKNVRLHKDGQQYVLSVVPLPSVDDPLVHQQFAALARQVSGAFGGKPVRVDLCDMWGTPKKKLPAERGPGAVPRRKD